MICTACKCYRTSLKTCTVCKKKVCGCCSLKSKVNNQRACCYPGDEGCYRAMVQAAKEAAGGIKAERG